MGWMSCNNELKDDVRGNGGLIGNGGNGSSIGNGGNGGKIAIGAISAIGGMGATSGFTRAGAGSILAGVFLDLGSLDALKLIGV
jgi:hypothetical protein